MKFFKAIAERDAVERCFHVSPLRAQADVVESTREIKGKTSTERRYFLCSFANLEQFAQTVRDHWSIENSQHWVLDVPFCETPTVAARIIRR